MVRDLVAELIIGRVCYGPSLLWAEMSRNHSWMLSFASVLWPIKFIIGKHYRESAARILLRTCAVMLRTRTIIMADKFCPYFGDYFCCFCFGNCTFYCSFGKECIKWLILDKTRTGKRHDRRFLRFFRLQ